METGNRKNWDGAKGRTGDRERRRNEEKTKYPHTRGAPGNSYLLILYSRQETNGIASTLLTGFNGSEECSHGRNAGYPAPPYRSQACETTALGSCLRSNAKTLIRVRVQHPRCGNPLHHLSLHAFPGQVPTFLAPSAQGAQPGMTDLCSEGIHQCLLNNLVFQSSYADRTLSPVGFGYPGPFTRSGPIPGMILSSGLMTCREIKLDTHLKLRMNKRMTWNIFLKP